MTRPHNALYIPHGVMIGAGLVALAIRFYLTHRFGERAESPMHILAGGIHRRSALTSFASATLKLGRQ